MNKLFINRTIAVMIDSLIIGIPVFFIDLAFSLIRWIMSWLPIIHHFRFLFSTSFLFVIVYALYEAIMVYFASGTIGKMIMKLDIEKENGRMSFSDCLIRGLIKAFSLHVWIIGAVSAVMALSDSHSSLHDRISGTSVWEKL